MGDERMGRGELCYGQCSIAAILDSASAVRPEPSPHQVSRSRPVTKTASGGQTRGRRTSRASFARSPLLRPAWPQPLAPALQVTAPPELLAVDRHRLGDLAGRPRLEPARAAHAAEFPR